MTSLPSGHHDPCVNLPCLQNLDCCNQSRSATFSKSLHTFSQRNANLKSHAQLNEIEDILATELNNLSVQERSRAEEDIHCVGEDLHETPEQIQRSFMEFEQKVQGMRNPVYEMAFQQNRAYVTDRSFRLRFLRANKYDVKAAVRQMMKFLSMKAKYFGNDKVAVEITLEDMNMEDMKCMLSGALHIQKDRDRAGRLVFFFTPSIVAEQRFRVDTLARTFYYIFNNIMIHVPEVQKKGLACVDVNIAKVGKKRSMIPAKFGTSVVPVVSSIPIRFSAFHICVSDGNTNLLPIDAILSSIAKMLPAHVRARMRLHRGSFMELHYKLRDHGIRTETCPFDVEGNIRQNILNAWFDKHQSELKEASQPFMNEAKAASLLNPDGAQGISSSSSDMIDWKEGNSGANVASLSHGDAVPGMLSPFSNDEASDSRGGVLKRESEGDGAMGGVEPNQVAIAALRRRKIARRQVEEPVITFSENDVLFGRGRLNLCHPGNIRYRQILDQNTDAYGRAPRRNRRKLATDWTHELVSGGFRFLKLNENDEWIEEQDFDEVVSKVCQFFRTSRSRKNRL